MEGMSNDASSCRPDEAQSSTVSNGPMLLFPFDEEEFEELKQHYCNRRVRTNHELPTGMILRRQTVPAIIDSDTGPFRALKAEYTRLENDSQEHAMYCLLKRLALWHMNKILVFPVADNEAGDDGEIIHEIIDVDALHGDIHVNDDLVIDVDSADDDALPSILPASSTAQNTFKTEVKKETKTKSAAYRHPAFAARRLKRPSQKSAPNMMLNIQASTKRKTKSTVNTSKVSPMTSQKSAAPRKSFFYGHASINRSTSIRATHVTGSSFGNAPQPKHRHVSSRVPSPSVVTTETPPVGKKKKPMRGIHECDTKQGEKRALQLVSLCGPLKAMKKSAAKKVPFKRKVQPTTKSPPVGLVGLF